MKKVSFKKVKPELAYEIRVWLNNLPPTKKGKAPWKWSLVDHKVIFVRSQDATAFKLKFDK